MSPHPFDLPYIGLGLLDPDSIRRDGATWTADYPDAGGRPYMRVVIDPDGATLTEFDEAGEPVATTGRPTLEGAIGPHGGEAVNARPSRFLMRLAPRVVDAWFPLDADVRYVFVPSIVLATLRVPLAAGSVWHTPQPGPLADRLGFAFDEDEGSPVPARLVRWFEGEPEARTDRIDVRHLTVPAILLPELSGPSPTRTIASAGSSGARSSGSTPPTASRSAGRRRRSCRTAPDRACCATRSSRTGRSSPPARSIGSASSTCLPKPANRRRTSRLMGHAVAEVEHS